MLNRYRKTDAPGWQRKLLLFLGFLFGATILLLVAWAITLFVDPDSDAEDGAVPVQGEMG